MRKILIVLSEWGFWGEELIGPLETFDNRGYESHFCTPTGKRPHALPPSMDPNYIDPPLGKSVTSAEMAQKVNDIDNQNNQRLENPRNLSAWFPERPYWSGCDDNGNPLPGNPQVLRLWEEYYSRRAQAQKEATDEFDAVLLVGGSGPMIDMVNNYRVHDVILGFLQAGKPIAAECYGVAWPRRATTISARASSGASMSPDMPLNTTIATTPAFWRPAAAMCCSTKTINSSISARRSTRWNTFCGTLPARTDSFTGM